MEIFLASHVLSLTQLGAFLFQVGIETVYLSIISSNLR